MITDGLTIVIISILFYINFDFILFSFIVVKTYNINIIICSFPERGFIMSVSYVGELFGRDSILDSLSNRLEIALKGKGCIDLLHGDAGIGKSAIINKFAVLHPEVQTLYVQCSALTDADDLYKPCSDLLNSIESIKWQEQSKVKKFFGSFNMEKVFDVGGKILGFIPGLELPSAIIDLAISAYAGDTNPEVLAETYKNDKVKLYSDIILGLSMEKPLVVVFDDLHWADRGTVNVFKHIFQIMLESRQGLNDKKFNLLLIGSLRGSEAKADSLHNGINEMFSFMDRYNFGRTQKLMIQHEVQELDAVSVQALITYNFDNDEKLSDGLKRWLCESSNGNPLLLSNLIDVLRENSAVESTSTGWVDFNEVSYIADSPVLKGRMLRLEKQGAFRSKSVVALEALRNLTDTELKILYVASIFKEYFTIESLAHVCKIIESDLYWPINRLIKMGFILEQGEVDNGLEVQNRYQIKSKALIEALRNDMSVHQITYYENSLGEYYSSKIKAVDYMEETVDSLDVSDLVAKPVISDKYSKINKVRDFYHKMASYHYMKGKNSLKAIEHGLFGIERLVERYKETKEQTPSPLELDGLYKTIESQISLYDTLFDKVIDELILVKHNDNELIQHLKIRALKIYAQFYGCFGQYSKASQYLNTALMLTSFTESEIDDAELMVAVAEINIDSGNFTKAGQIIGKLLDYLEEYGNSWESSQYDDIIENLLLLISIDSSLQAKYISKVSSVAIKLKSECIIDAQFAELEFYLRHNDLERAKELIIQIESIHSDINWAHYLGDQLSTLSLYKIPKDVDEQLELLADDWNAQYNYKVKKDYQWGLNVCNLFLSILLKEIKVLDEDSLSSTVEETLALLSWLYSLLRLNPDIAIKEYTDDEHIQSVYKDRVLELQSQAINILEVNKHNIDLQAIYNWFYNQIKSGLYIEERDSILRYFLTSWPEYIDSKHIEYLFIESMNSTEVLSNISRYENNIAAWRDYYLIKPSHGLADLVVHSLEEAIKALGNNLLVVKLVDDILLEINDFKQLVDCNKYIKLAVDICLEYSEYHKARNLSRHATKMLSDELLLKIDDLENKEYEKCLDKSNLELFSYNGEDQFSRFITAEKLINQAELLLSDYEPDEEIEDYDIIEGLKLYVSAYNLMKNNEYAETKIDDICESIANYIDELEEVDLSEFVDIFGEESIYEIPELSKLVLQLKFQYEALKINQTLGDTNRVVECLANMITTVEKAINPGESDDDEDNIENEVDEGLSYNEVDNALKTLDLSIEAILSLHQQLLVENTMLDTALEQYFEFDDLSGYDFADEYIIPSVKSSVEQIVQNIDNPILTNYVNSLLAVKNPF